MKNLIGAILLGVAAMAAQPVSADIYEMNAGPFDRIQVRGDFNVVYRSNPDSTGFVRYESDVDFSPAMAVNLKDGKLSIIAKYTEEELGKAPVIHVYSDYLVSASNEGNGMLDIDISISTPTLSVKQVGNGKVIVDGVNCTTFSANIETGNGSIVARGKCENAKFKLTGAGVIQADAMTADEIQCTVLGTGTIGCHPVELLDVRGIGTTKIYYYGNPTVKKVGGARLEKMAGGRNDSIPTEQEED